MTPAAELIMTAALAQIAANGFDHASRVASINADARVQFLTAVYAETQSRITEGGNAGLAQMSANWGSAGYYRHKRAGELCRIRRAKLYQGWSNTAKETLAHCAKLRRSEVVARRIACGLSATDRAIELAGAAL